MSDLDINAVSADVIAKLTKESAAAIYAKLSSVVSTTKAVFFERFQEYIRFGLEKHSYVRTIFEKHKPTSLYSLYVSPVFKHGDRSISDEDLLSHVLAGERVLVRGNGGCGKTFFLKHVFCEVCKNPRGKIPIYIELRRLNDLSKLDIFNFCRGELRSDLMFGKGVFEKLCSDGRFIFIFDGFDEVKRDKRRETEKQIIELTDRFPNCGFLASGRDDDRFAGWGAFKSYTVDEFSIEQVRALLSKINWDKKVKEKFLKALDADFYKEHQSFLSSPLMAIIMLMTFHDDATIHQKLTSFYEGAFNTLMSWHDATKDSFERDRALDVDTFKKVFATFCLLSYYENTVFFTDSKFRGFVAKALDYHKVVTDVDEVQLDICESVNLVTRDGLNFAFVHRSFQEYFAAYCVMRVLSKRQAEFLSAFAKRLADNVFLMCYEIHEELVLDLYILPAYQRLQEKGIFSISRALDGSILQKMGFEVDFFAAVAITRQGRHFLSLRGARIRSEDSEDNLIAICSRLFARLDKEVDLFVGSEFFDVLFSGLDQVDKLDEFERIEEDLRVDGVIKVNGTTIDVSWRNTGKRRVSRDLLNTARSNLQRSYTSRRKAIERRVRYQIKTVSDHLRSIEAKRVDKQKSIDDLLGL